MKKIFLVCCTFAICLLASSCGSDGCSVVGEWSVSNVKLESTKFSESMIEMMETEYLGTSYKFNKDGTMSITSSNGASAPGTYVLDATASELIWKDDQNQSENVLKISTCTTDAIQIVQRMPADEAQEMTLQASLTLVPKK